MGPHTLNLVSSAETSQDSDQTEVQFEVGPKTDMTDSMVIRRQQLLQSKLNLQDANLLQVCLQPQSALGRQPALGVWTGPVRGRNRRPGLSLGTQIFFLLRRALKDSPQGPPTANRHQPPTANRQPPPTANRQPVK